MCGIVGYVGQNDALPIVISGLEKLEYRGYDSAGVAMYEDGKLKVTRAKGKLAALKDELSKVNRTVKASMGLGHTRWATHGKPSEVNAHPHTAGRITLIHNGIIENYNELREELLTHDCSFSSETDTEVAAHLINYEIEKVAGDPNSKNKDVSLQGFINACKKLKGSYAILAIDTQVPDRIMVAKTATPIVIGVGDKELVVASDIPAVLNYTKDVIILEDGDIAELRADSLKVQNNGIPVERVSKRITWDPVTAQKGGYKHYMLKEIHEQVSAIADTLRGRIDYGYDNVRFSELKITNEEIKKINRVVFVACGTAWHACLVGKYYFESIANIPCEVDYASEFRYRDVVLDDSTLVIAVSQSGETADTIAAIELAGKKTKTLCLSNVLDSTLTRKVNYQVYTHAGPEISVASTKAFTTQLVALYLLAIYFGQARGKVDSKHNISLIHDALKLPSVISEALKIIEPLEKISRKFQTSKDFLYLGRGLCYPIALEGALKLKELSYIHAEGYPAGEIKHGPLALIDENMPVVVLLQKDSDLFEKTVSNLREVESRGGKVIAITDSNELKDLPKYVDSIVEFPYLSKYLSPIVLTIPLQLISYFIAAYNGTDVDLPRNLAKSVTVE